MVDLFSEQSSNPINEPQAQNADFEETSAPSSSYSNGNHTKANSFKNSKRKQRNVWISVSLCVLLVTVIAAGYFFILQPRLAVRSEIRKVIRLELGDDVIPVDLDKQVWSGLLQSKKDTETTYIVTIQTPDYGKLTAEEVTEKVSAPAFDIAVEEAEYRAMLDKLVADAAINLLEANSQGRFDRQITVHVLRKNGGARVILEDSELSSFRDEQSKILRKLQDGVYESIPQSKQYQLAANKDVVLAGIFDDGYLIRNTEVKNVVEKTADDFTLVLRFPYPAGLEDYCKALPIESGAEVLELDVYMGQGVLNVADSEKERASAALTEYYSMIGQQLESAGEERAASIAYAKAGDYIKACAVYDWSNSLQLSQMNAAALKLDGTLLFCGGFETDSIYENNNNYRVFEASNAPDLSGWTDIAAIQTNSFNLTGLKKDGTVLFAGNLWRQDDEKNSTRSAVWEESYQPDLSAWMNVTTIQSSRYILAGLKSDGTVESIGFVAENGLDRQPVDTSSWTNIVRIYVFNDAIFGIRSDGTVISAGKHYDWDSNRYVEYDFQDWTSIADLAFGIDDFTTSAFVIGLRADGTVVSDAMCWINSDMEGGRSSFAFKELDLSGWNGITKVIYNNCFAAGLRVDGSVCAAGSLAKAIGDPNLMGDLYYTMPEAIDLTGWEHMAALQGSLGYKASSSHCGFIIGIDQNGTVRSEGALTTANIRSFYPSLHWNHMLAVSVSKEQINTTYFFRDSLGVLGLSQDGTVHAYGDLILSVYDPSQLHQAIYLNALPIEVAGWKLW